MRVALIGLGGVGALHFTAYQQIAGIEVVAAAEPDERRRTQILEGTAIAAFGDHRELLRSAQFDIACVLTPAASHEAIVLDCAAHGVHVLCEKPVALTLEAAHRMRAACVYAGVEFCYGASYRYLPAVKKARELITDGVIGQVQLLREEVLGGRGLSQWHPLPEHHYPKGGPGGSGLGLMDHGIHLIDIFRWFTGREITRAVGRGNRAGAPPVTEFLQMDFEGGATGLLVYNDASFSTQLPNEGHFAEGAGWDIGGSVQAGGWSAHPGFIEVFGTNGSLRIYHYANALYLFRSTWSAPHSGNWPRESPAFRDADRGVRRESARWSSRTGRCGSGH